MEKTLVLLKPDALSRNLIGEITKRLEQKGLKLIGMKMMQLDENILKKHYSHIADKPFFPGIANFMQKTPVIAQCWSGKEAVAVIRQLCGITNAREALPGTIRGDFSMSIQCNVIHASEDFAIAKEEVKRFFKEEELFEYDKLGLEYTYSSDERE